MARIQRQGRLFAPLGMFKGSPDRLSPDQFTAGNVPGHTVAWHAQLDLDRGKGATALPAYDAPERNPALAGIDEDGYLDDEAFDDEGRYMASYGSAVGLHFGTKQAAIDRSRGDDERHYVHPVAFANSDIQHLRGSENYNDQQANYSSSTTDAVEAGKVIPYTNGLEDKGSVSYRALPQTVKTWGEHVLDAHAQHDQFADRWGRSAGNMGLPRPSTAQVAAAKAGYNPVIPLQENIASTQQHRVQQASLFAGERWNDNVGHYDKHYTSPADVSTQLRAGVPSGLNIERPNADIDHGRSFYPPEQRDSMLGRVQFRKTGLRE